MEYVFIGCFFFKGNLIPKVSEKLNQATLPIVDFQTCSKPTYWWDTLRPSMICAGYESPDELKSACQVRKHIQEDKKIKSGELFLCLKTHKRELTRI